LQLKKKTNKLTPAELNLNALVKHDPHESGNRAKELADNVMISNNAQMMHVRLSTTTLSKTTSTSRNSSEIRKYLSNCLVH